VRAVPVRAPEPLRVVVTILVIAGSICRDVLDERKLAAAGVLAAEGEQITAHLGHQVTQQRQWQPGLRQVRAVLADDPGQGAQIPFARGQWSPHRPLLSPGDFTLRPAAPVRVSAEHRMADASRKVAPWR
jgi:hypothetical protein